MRGKHTKSTSIPPAPTVSDAKGRAILTPLLAHDLDILFHRSRNNVWVQEQVIEESQGIDNFGIIQNCDAAGHGASTAFVG